MNQNPILVDLNRPLYKIDLNITRYYTVLYIDMSTPLTGNEASNILKQKIGRKSKEDIITRSKMPVIWPPGYKVYINLLKKALTYLNNKILKITIDNTFNHLKYNFRYFTSCNNKLLISKCFIRLKQICIIKNKCIARVWNYGYGRQCSRNICNRNLCKTHLKQLDTKGSLSLNTIYEPKPNFSGFKPSSI